MTSEFKVFGSRNRGFGVSQDGGILYDLLETREEAETIATLLRQGVGPDWNAISSELPAKFTLTSW